MPKKPKPHAQQESSTTEQTIQGATPLLKTASAVLGVLALLSFVFVAYAVRGAPALPSSWLVQVAMFVAVATLPQFVISPVARIVEELADIGERRDKWWLRNPGAFVGIVERPVFPHPYDAKKPMSREVAVTELWPALRDAAGIPKAERYGWHSFRRAFANALRDVPLRELKDLGGWKNQNTVVMVYLRPDEDAQRKALAKLSGTR